MHKVRNKDLVLPFSREDREIFFLFFVWKALFGKFHYNDIKAAFTLKTTLRVLKLSLVLLLMHPKGLRPRKKGKARLSQQLKRRITSTTKYQENVNSSPDEMAVLQKL